MTEDEMDASFSRPCVWNGLSKHVMAERMITMGENPHIELLINPDYYSIS
jgi:hypothetical protein